MSADQLELILPRRDPDEMVRERLGYLVAEANSAVDPLDRVRLHHEVVELRRVLREGGGL